MEKDKKLYKNIIFIFLAAFFVFVNFYTSFSVIPLYVLELGGDEFFSGVQSTVFFVAGVILRFYFGPLADRKGRKLPLFTGAFVFATTPLLVMAVSHLWMLIPVRVYQGIGLAAFLSSSSSFVTDIAPREKAGAYIGMYRMVISLALLAGPAGAQAVINYYGFDFWFTGSFALGLLSVLFVMLVDASPLPGGKVLSTWSNMYRALVNKKLWPAYWGVFLLSVVYGGILSFASLYIDRVTGIANPGIYFTYFALAGLAGNISAGYLSDRLGRSRVVWPLIMTLALGSISLYFTSPGYAFMVLSSCLAGAGFSGGVAALIAWLVDRAEDKIRATVLSVEESIIDLAMALGAFILGTASGFIGLPLSFVLTGAVVFVAASVSLGREFTRKGNT